MIDGFYPKSNLTYIFLIIYQYIKYVSNTPIFLKKYRKENMFQNEKGP